MTQRTLWPNSTNSIQLFFAIAPKQWLCSCPHKSNLAITFDNEIPCIDASDFAVRLFTQIIFRNPRRTEIDLRHVVGYGHMPIIFAIRRLLVCLIARRARVPTRLEPHSPLHLHSPLTVTHSLSSRLCTVPLPLREFMPVIAPLWL